MSRAIYPGSFDPATYGHLDIIQRAAAMVDELIVGVLVNQAKRPMFSIDERVGMLQYLMREYSNVRICSFTGLLVDFARQEEAGLIVRGLRAVTDFEYELQMAQTNRILYEQLDTVFLATSPEYAYLSSSVVREVASLGGEIRSFVPDYVRERIQEKIRENK